MVGRKVTDDEDEYIELLPLIRRAFAWDVIPCHEVGNFFPLFDLLPGSEEGHEKEHRAKHDRYERLAPITTAIDVYSAVVSDIITKVMLRYDMPEYRSKLEDTGALKLMSEQNLEIIRIATYASLAELFDSEIITFGKAVSQ